MLILNIKLEYFYNFKYFESLFVLLPILILLRQNSLNKKVKTVNLHKYLKSNRYYLKN